MSVDNQTNDYASEFYGYWTPEAFEREGGDFAKNHGLFIVSTEHFNKAVSALIAQAETRGFVNGAQFELDELINNAAYDGRKTVRVETIKERLASLKEGSKG